MNPLNLNWLVAPIPGTDSWAIASSSPEAPSVGVLWIGGFESREDAHAWLNWFLLAAYREQLRDARRIARILAAMEPASTSVH